MMYNFLRDSRFEGIEPLADRAHLAIAALHQDDEMKFINLVYSENYLTTEGANVNGLEAAVAEFMSVPGREKKAVALCNGTAAIHLAVKLAAESLGAYTTVTDRVSGDAPTVPTGSVGDYGIVSMNGNKIITGSRSGALIVPDEYSYNKAKKWSTQAREAAPWYEHEELGYNYRISNVIAGIVRGQWLHLEEHIAQKRSVFERYAEGFKDLPVTVHGGGNYWLSTMLIDEEAMAEHVRGDRKASYCY